MSDFLVPESKLAGLDQGLKELVKANHEAYSVDRDDELYGAAFRRYLLFSRWPSRLAEAGLHLSDEEMLYNSYYWILKFSKLHELKNGYDAGVEQQVFKVIEQASGNVDWAVVEQITNLVEKELGRPT